MATEFVPSNFTFNEKPQILISKSMKIQIRLGELGIYFENFYLDICDWSTQSTHQPLTIYQQTPFNPKNLCRRFEKAFGKIDHRYEESRWNDGYDYYEDFDED